MTDLNMSYGPRSLDLSPNRPNGLGLTMSTLLPIAAMIIVNGMLSLLAPTYAMPDFPSPFGALPSWLVAAVWFAIYPMWGAARWYAYQASAKGRVVSWWVVALIGWGIVYPLVLPHLDAFFGTWISVASLFLGLITGIKLARVSKIAFFLVLPSLLWISLSSALSFLSFSQGWAPPFGATNSPAQQ